MGRADVDASQMIALVAEDAGVDREAAERATQAVLETLAERLAKGEADDLAAQLPAEVAAWLHTTTPAEGFDVDEFLDRVAKRAGVDLATAERYARAVLTALGRAVSRGEYDDMVAELSRDYARLLPRGPRVDVPGADEFIRRVAERAGLDTERARHATHAVLTALAERISGGEVEDLAERLPAELHAPLKVGNERSNGVARKMSLAEFEALVARLEGVSPAEAHGHVRAVLTTLRETVGAEEFSDVSAQLPDEYDVVLPVG
jgi:uncharacterized protein (DUF2267 family)